jgi:heme/copper-type cytochrome/quinol oxidase subunit 2
MKSNTSMNVMLVVFCAVLVVFVFFSSKVSELNKTKQAELEHSTK